MIYTADMVQRAVTEAAKGARQTAITEERDRICRLIASAAAISSSETAREELWEVIRAIRVGAL